MSLYDVMRKFPGVHFKKQRGIWWATWETVGLCDKDLDVLAEMIEEAQEKGYE